MLICCNPWGIFLDEQKGGKYNLWNIFKRLKGEKCNP